MKTFCVAFFNGHAGELTQTIVQAVDTNDALLSYLETKGYFIGELTGSKEDFNDFCECADIWIHAEELTNVKIL